MISEDHVTPKTELMMLKIYSFEALCDFILKYVKQETNVRNCNNISQYYCFFLYFDQINCCICITLLQVRIAVVQNSNIRGLSLKVNSL